MLFGEHSVIYDRPCIVTAVDQRLSVEVSRLDNDLVLINAPDVDVKSIEVKIKDLGKNKRTPIGIRFVERSIINFFDKYKLFEGLKVTTKSDFSSKFGFGSSSAVTVGTIASLFELFGVKYTKRDIFNLSYKTVLDVQGLGSGFDLAAAVWGGTLYFVTGGKKIEPLKVGELPLVIGYTGIKADTTSLVKRVASFKKKEPKTAESIFDSITLIVEEAKKSINQKDFKGLGLLMNRNQELLGKLGVSSDVLDNLIKATIKSGALGAKLSGAGGGDCMLALITNEKHSEVKKAIVSQGGEVLQVGLNSKGLKVEK